MVATRVFEQDGAGKMAQAVEFARPPIIAFFGDSIADFAANPGSAISPFFYALAESYWGDCFIDERSFANGGYNFGVGGTSSTDLLTNQIGQLRSKAVKPDIAYVQTLQNDFIASLATAQSFAANVTSFATQALAAGVKLVILCPVPPKTATASPAAKDAANRILEKFAAATPGVVFLDYLAYVMDPTGAFSTTSIEWKGTTGTANGYSSDGVHPSKLASRAIAAKLAPILQRVMRPLSPRAKLGNLFDPVAHPDGNVFGENGLFKGTGGDYNAVANANVAGVATTGTWNRWSVTDGTGIVATPTLTTDVDGFIAQRLTFSGTATADATVTLMHQYFFDVPSAQYNAEALLRFNAVNALRGFTFNAGSTSFNGDDNSVMASPLNGMFYLRGRRAATFANSGFGGRNATFTFVFKSGASPTGSVDVSRCGLFREG